MTCQSPLPPPHPQMMTFFTDVLVEKEGGRLKLTPIMPQNGADSTKAALKSISGA